MGNNKRLIFAVLVSLGVGAMMAGDKPLAAAPITQSQQQLTQEVATLKARDTHWQELKRIDDSVINVAAEVTGIAADSMRAVSRFDAVGVAENNVKLEALQPRLQALASDRQATLSALGF